MLNVGINIFFEISNDTNYSRNPWNKSEEFQNEIGNTSETLRYTVILNRVPVN